MTQIWPLFHFEVSPMRKILKKSLFLEFSVLKNELLLYKGLKTLENHDWVHLEHFGNFSPAGLAFDLFLQKTHLQNSRFIWVFTHI